MIPHLSERALILAPQGRDAEIAGAILAEAGFRAAPCRNLDHLVGEVTKGAGFAVVAEEALRTADLSPLAAWLKHQEEWSDFPFILLTLRGGGLERNPAAGRHLETLGNVTFLERPFHPTTLVSLAGSARRARLRQYEARARLLELHDFAAELEHRVEVRTAERQEALERLHEAQKLETLGQLTGGVAHDFNNLLTPILGALDLLQRRLGKDDPRVDRWLDNALKSGERAKTLVQRLLGFARRQDLQTRPVDVAGLLEGMRDLIRSSVGPMVELQVACADDLPAATADPHQLELALLNLCVNARDAMPEGGPLSVTAEPARLEMENDAHLPPGLYARLSVVDGGAGMDSATLARAVEPFFSTKETGRGTGLGLSLVHGLAAQLGGAFVLHSTPGSGTRAELYLPAADGAAARYDRESAAAPPASRPRTILLVDDEDLVRTGVADMLRSLGHRVVEADSGERALDVVSERTDLDLVITDYRMPRMSGAALTRELRQRAPTMPVLLITGYTGKAEASADVPRLEKPFGLEELARALGKVGTA